MLKKIIIILILLFVFFSLASADLIDIYKKGEIGLIPDHEFGKNTNWDEMFYKGIKSIAFAEDGSFFVTALGGISHSIYKFDKNGNFIKKFGRKGRGPGDLYHPGNLSILDNKYLVIREYGTSRRISIFDLNGNFVKIIKTRCPVFDVVGLKNSKIAILGSKTDKTPDKITYIIIILNLNNNREIHVVSFIKKIRKTSIRARDFEGKACISRTKNGDLLVGFSNNQKIVIYSPDGKKIFSFSINTKQIKVTKKMKEEFYKGMESNIEKKPMRVRNQVRKLVKKMRSMDIFPKYAPYYKNLIVDCDGNFIVFYNKGYFKAGNWWRFQVYSPNGKYICDSQISSEKSKFKIITPLVFHNDSLYCFTKLRDRKDNLLRIIKVKLK
jgi:WD40 repeat protein